MPHGSSSNGRLSSDPVQESFEVLLCQLLTACRCQPSILAEATFRLPGASRPAAGSRRATESSSIPPQGLSCSSVCPRWRVWLMQHDGPAEPLSDNHSMGCAACAVPKRCYYPSFPSINTLHDLIPPQKYIGRLTAPLALFTHSRFKPAQAIASHRPHRRLACITPTQIPITPVPKNKHNHA